MEQPKVTMKSGDSNDRRESSKSMFEELLKHLDSEDEDDLEDEMPERSEKQIATVKERDKEDVSGSEDLTVDFLYKPYVYEPYVFPYEDYRIIGDTSEIDKIIHTSGSINIDVADITSALSTDTVNYVTVGVGCNITDAIEQSVDNLPITSDQVEKMLFQILISKDYKQGISVLNSIGDFINKCNKDIDLFWGIAYDESLTDSIKVILIASSK